jgi:enterochelin esterase family protein
MLVVMPNGSLPRLEIDPDATPEEQAVALAESQNRFTNELMNDVIPTVRDNFRVLDNAENRAIAGLSMGGGQTLRVLMTHPDTFAHVAIWSAGLFRQDPSEFESQNAAFFEKADELNRTINVLDITVGEDDFAFAGSKNLSELFTKNGIEHNLKVSSGGHTWINWRRYLSEYAPLLFR